MLIKPFSLIVSCQAFNNEALRDSYVLAKIALAAKNGGASWIRANGPEDIKGIKKLTGLPVIGIYKDFESLKKSEAFITVRKWQIKEIIEAGAEVVAIDCTRRPRPEPLNELFRFVRKNYPSVEIIADIADLEDVKTVLKLKPDYFSTTLTGYTDYTMNHKKPDIELISKIKEITDIPVIAEGHYKEPRQVRQALIYGAHAVVVGTAITRPQVLTRNFYDALKDFSYNTKVLGVDIGGTWIRMVVVDLKRNILERFKFENPQEKNEIFSEISRVVQNLGDITHIGVASAGRVDVETGIVTFASDNIKNWSGVNIKNEIFKRTGLIPTVDNDANAAAFAQWDRTKEENLVLLTVGTGIGGGAVVNGEILKGKNGGAFEIGHLIYPLNTNKCTCGKTGCVETLLNGKSLKSAFEIKDKKKIDFISEVYAWLIDSTKMFVDFDKFYLTGVIKFYGDEFLNKIRKQYEKLSVLNKGEDILFSTLDEFGGAYGAALESLYFGGESK
ncbi:MAG: putative N-acetylmannosamine-6-phosphate 2-epimerase [Thermosipho sp. (in: Bacteria)]|nr:putative N-acetylmannosamine-6-phosphate 2-epimerase [Thermosipho sp. (in: thermotogales)]